MSTINRPDPKLVPPLEAGQRLDRTTFHERYDAMPPTTRAELIGGLVHMPSPVRNDHGEVDEAVGYWLSHYRRFTPPLRAPRNVTTQLDADSEIQPDCLLRIPSELGGQSSIDEHGYITGPPELIVEVGRSSRRVDLGAKKDDYERTGVLEYVFVGIEPNEIRWFIRREGRFVDLHPGTDGVFRSEVFPGLWLDPSALFAEDLDRLVGVLDQGLATPEHQTFGQRLVEGDRAR